MPNCPERKELLQALNWDVLVNVTTAPAALGLTETISSSFPARLRTTTPSSFVWLANADTPPVDPLVVTNESPSGMVIEQSGSTLYVPTRVFSVTLPTVFALNKFPAPSASMRPIAVNTFRLDSPVTRLPMGVLLPVTVV